MEKIFKYNLFFITISVLFLFSCKDDELETAPRLFRPLLTCNQGVSSAYLVATWTNLTTNGSGVDKFQVELSTDSFATISQTVIVEDCEHKFDSLVWDRDYQVRVKSLGNDGRESEYYMAGINLTYPTFLSSIKVTENALRVYWSKNDSTYSSIKVYLASNDSLVAEKSISATDTTNKYADVYGLKELTKYKIVAYSGSRYQGRKYATTVAGQVYPYMIDIRDTTDAIADTMLSTSFFNSLPSGTVVILKRGNVYSLSTSYFNKSVTLVTGLGLDGDLATLSIANSKSFNITAGAVVDSVKFSNVIIKGQSPSSGFPGNFGGCYVMNVNTACNVSNFILDGCTIKYLRGVCRLQNPSANFNTVKINNCIIDSIGGYGIVNFSYSGSIVSNIYITNTTISNTVKFITNIVNLTCKTLISINNCTFYSLPQSTGYIIDISTSKEYVSDLTIANSIFGPALKSTATSGATTTPTYSFNGYRADFVNVNGNTINNYVTSDVVWAGSTGASSFSFNTYSKKSTVLFKSVSTSDFTINDKTFAGKSTAGDPRWRP